MAKYSIHAAKTHFSKLIEKALNGEEIIIAKRNKSLLKLVPLEPPKRRFGLFEGKIRVSKDFNEPLDDFRDY